MKHSRLVLSSILVMMFAFFVTGCSEFNNPVSMDDNEFDVRNISFSEGLVPVCGAVDDVKLIGSDGSETVYEDAEDGLTERWFINWDDPTGAATISNVDDVNWGSRVINLFDDGSIYWFILGNGFGSWDYPWNNTTQFTLEWSMKYNIDYTVMLRVLNTDGDLRELRYVPEDNNNGPHNWDPPTMVYGLGSDTKDGQWHTFTRDLELDFESAFTGETLGTILWFKIKGPCDYVPPEAWTIGYWKNNIRKHFLETGKNKGNGTQVTEAQLLGFIDEIKEFYETPFNNLTPEIAYDILSTTSSDPKDLLSKQLLAAEFNVASGDYLEFDPDFIVMKLKEGEDLLLDPLADKDAILALKDLLDAFNNGDPIPIP
jgi:hypothetical protein